MNRSIEQIYSNPFYLSSSENLGLAITSVIFNGSTFLAWSKSIQLILGAKLKLGFIDGICIWLENDKIQLEKWSRCDDMIRCWLMNSMAKELYKGFGYAKSAKELSDDVV